MQLDVVPLVPPEGFQVILGQSHFIKTVEDLYEALASSMPGIKFGVAFSEASGKSLVRSDGSDEKATALAREFCASVGAGHSFVVVLSGAFPINVLNRIKSLEEVASVYCATANRLQVVVADEGGGRGILGVIDGVSPKGSETAEDVRERKEFLRRIGYKR